MILKPPATPRPGIGDEFRTLTIASLTRFRNSGSSRAMMSSAFSPGALRLSNGSRTMNIEPKLDAFDCSRNDIPEMVTVWATPGVSQGDLVDQLHRLLGALQRRRVGQLDAHDQPALVLLRNEARRGVLEDPVRQHHQTAVDEEHDAG